MLIWRCLLSGQVRNSFTYSGTSYYTQNPDVAAVSNSRIGAYTRITHERGNTYRVEFRKRHIPNVRRQRRINIRTSGTARVTNLTQIGIHNIRFDIELPQIGDSWMLYYDVIVQGAHQGAYFSPSQRLGYGNTCYTSRNFFSFGHRRQ